MPTPSFRLLDALPAPASPLLFELAVHSNSFTWIDEGHAALLLEQELASWNLKTGAVEACLRLDHPLTSLALSPDRRQVALGDEKGTVGWRRLRGFRPVAGVEFPAVNSRACLPALAAVIFGAGLLSACTPSRDNINDPYNKPIARLNVFATQPDGSLLPAQAGSRATVFVFDASQSTGSAGNKDGLSFSFALDRPSLAPSDPQYDDFSTAPNGPGTLTTHLVLTTADAPIPGSAGPGSQAGTGNWNYTVQVKVRSSNGAESVAAVQVVLHNSAPIPSTGEDLFVAQDLPLVTLDACGGKVASQCTTHDPDGDPLLYTWTQIGGTPVTLLAVDTAGQRVQFQPPTGGSTAYEFQMTASDGMARASALASVYVTSQAWVGFSQPSRVLRIFPEFRTPPGFTTTAGSAAWPASMGAVAGGATADTTLVATSAPSVVHEFDQSFNEVLRWTAPSVDTSNDLVLSLVPGCDAVTNFATSTGYFTRLLDGGAVVVVPDNPPPPHNGSDSGGAKWVLPAGGGQCWTVGSQVGILQTNGSWASASDFSIYNALAATTLDDGSLCALVELTVGPQGARGPATLQCVPAGGGAHTTIPIAPSLNPYGLSFLSRHPDGHSLLSYDASTGEFIRLGLDGTTSTEVGITPSAFVSPLTSAYDPLLRALWVEDFLSSTVTRYVFLNGAWAESGSMTLDQLPTLQPGSIYRWTSLAVDPISGDGIFSVDNIESSLDAGLVGRVPAHLRQQTEFSNEVFLNFRLSADPTRGTVWYSDEGNSFLQLASLSVRDADGTILAREANTAPNWSEVTASPTGGAWALQQRTNPALLELDPYANVLQTIPLANNNVPMAIGQSPDGQHLCLSAVDSFTLPTTTFTYRCDATVPSCELLGPTFSAPLQEPPPVRPAADDKGNCWFLGWTSGFPTPPYTTGRLVEVPSGSTAATVDVGVGNADPSVSCTHLALDPRGAHNPWVVSFSQGLLELNSAGGIAETFPEFALCVELQKVCDDPANPACLEVWQFVDPGTGVVLTRSSGTLLSPQSFPLGVGDPVQFSVRR